MLGFKYAVLWDFNFSPVSMIAKRAIQGTNIFALCYDEESAKQKVSELSEAGYVAWVEEL